MFFLVTARIPKGPLLSDNGVCSLVSVGMVTANSTEEAERKLGLPWKQPFRGFADITYELEAVPEIIGTLADFTAKTA